MQWAEKIIEKLTSGFQGYESAGEVQMNRSAASLSCYHGVVKPVMCESFVSLDARVP